MDGNPQQYFICLEYHSKDKKYGRTYISFGPNGLIYDVIYKYSLEQIDFFFATHSKTDIINQMKQDNVLYFLKEIEDINDITFSIHHYDQKERISAILLPEGCYLFDMEKYFKDYLDASTRKNLYNKLGGYLNNQHTDEKTKDFIRMIPNDSSNTLWEEYQKLPYFEQRKLRLVIYENANVDLQKNLKLSKEFNQESVSRLLKKAA